MSEDANALDQDVEIELWEKGQQKADDEIFDMDEQIKQGLIDGVEGDDDDDEEE